MRQSLKQSFIILKRINNQLFHAHDSLLYVIDRKKAAYRSTWTKEEIFRLDTCMYALIGYSFIWYKSFLDEYYRHFKSDDAEEKQKILKIKSIGKDCIEKVRVTFGDVEDARNKILAHGYRNKGMALNDTLINKYYNQLIDFDDTTVFSLISENVSLIILEIEKEFGALSDDEISLTEHDTDGSDDEL